MTQELTTHQAADLLDVSTAHFVSLLDSGDIPYHDAGTHRRIYLRDVLAYKQRRDESRRMALQALVDDAQNLGIYEE